MSIDPGDALAELERMIEHQRGKCLDPPRPPKGGKTSCDGREESNCCEADRQPRARGRQLSARRAEPGKDEVMACHRKACAFFYSRFSAREEAVRQRRYGPALVASNVVVMPPRELVSDAAVTQRYRSDDALSLKPGEYTHKPIQTQYGWHVIELVETRDLQPPAYDNVRQRLEQVVQAKKVKAYTDDLMRNAKIEKKLDQKKADDQKPEDKKPG